MKFLFVLLCVAAISDILGVFCFLYKISDIPLYLAYTAAEGFCLLPIYYIKAETKVIKTLVLFGFACFLCLFTLTLLLQWPNEILNTCVAVQLLLYSAITLYRFQGRVNAPDVQAESFFWINLGFFVYYGCSLFFLMFENKARYAPELMRVIISGTHMVINISYNLLLGFGLCKINRK